MQPRLVSGIQPTGTLHIGNYLGAMRQMLEMQEKYQAYIFIADLHALNQVHSPSELRQNIYQVLAAYLAIGLDPDKVTLFQQSAISAHAELCVILNAICSMGLLERSHAYKDSLANGKIANVGLFDYPVLMTADILLYQAEVVPVGKDQKQHLEIAGDLARRFNHLFGEYFTIPQAVIPEQVATIPGIDGRKMSKSYGNTISLFEQEDELRKKVFSIVTDSKRPEEPKQTEGDTLFQLHSFFPGSNFSELSHRYAEGGIGYRESKEILFNNLNNFIIPLRERYLNLLADYEYLDTVLSKGNDHASSIAERTLQEVKYRTGLR